MTSEPEFTYELKFLEDALEEWNNLDGSIKKPFRKLLQKRLKEPCPPGSKLKGRDDLYKIKLRKQGYRLVYRVIDQELIVEVIVVGRRDGNAVYGLMEKRIRSE